jgi:D-sedoheptulose 7-phosphate isomerase
MQYQQEITSHLNEASVVLNNFLDNAENIEKIESAAQIIADAIKSGGKIFSCGNGGSHCDAMHFAEELTGQYRNARPALPAIAIGDASHITCTANDYGFEEVYSRFLSGLGRPGDVLLCLSTSGNSANIIKAALEAKKLQMRTIALTGKTGGRLADMVDIELRVPHQGYSDRIQEVHIKIIHVLIYLVEKMVD